MNKVFTENGWTDYVYWQTEDRKTLKKINQLIDDICRNGNEGIGKPEPLSGNLAGLFFHAYQISLPLIIEGTGSKCRNAVPSFMSGASIQFYLPMLLFKFCNMVFHKHF